MYVHQEKTWKGCATRGGGLVAGNALQYGATKVPNVAVAVSASVSAQARVATATSRAVVTASAKANAVLPIGQMANGVLNAAGDLLNDFSYAVTLPITVTGTAFAATVCSIGR